MGGGEFEGGGGLAYRVFAVLSLVCIVLVYYWDGRAG